MRVFVTTPDYVDGVRTLYECRNVKRRVSAENGGMQRGHDEDDAKHHEERAQYEEKDGERSPPCSGAIGEPKGDREQGDERAGRDERRGHDNDKVEPVDAHVPPFPFFDFLAFCVARSCAFEGFFLAGLRTFGVTNAPGSGWWKLRWSSLLRRE